MFLNSSTIIVNHRCSNRSRVIRHANQSVKQDTSTNIHLFLQEEILKKFPYILNRNVGVTISMVKPSSKCCPFLCKVETHCLDMKFYSYNILFLTCLAKPCNPMTCGMMPENHHASCTSHKTEQHAFCRATHGWRASGHTGHCMLQFSNSQGATQNCTAKQTKTIVHESIHTQCTHLRTLAA